MLQHCTWPLRLSCHSYSGAPQLPECIKDLYREKHWFLFQATFSAFSQTKFTHYHQQSRGTPDVMSVLQQLMQWAGCRQTCQQSAKLESDQQPCGSRCITVLSNIFSEGRCNLINPGRPLAWLLALIEARSNKVRED